MKFFLEVFVAFVPRLDRPKAGGKLISAISAINAILCKNYRCLLLSPLSPSKWQRCSLLLHNE